jgi:transcription antitermination factor NusG
LVELRSGPFEGMTGRLLEADEEDWSAKVGVELFGRMTPVAVSVEELRRA